MREGNVYQQWPQEMLSSVRTLVLQSAYLVSRRNVRTVVYWVMKPYGVS